MVIGATVNENLFDGVNPIGQTVRVRNLPFRVVGVLSARGQSGMGQDQDDPVIMPYTSAQRKLLGQSVPRINQIMLRAVTPNATPVAEKMMPICSAKDTKLVPIWKTASLFGTCPTSLKQPRRRV